MTTQEQIHQQLVEARNQIDQRGWSPDGRGDGLCVVQATTAVASAIGAWRDTEWVLAQQLGIVSWELPAWNDMPGRTKEEVLALFDKAIAATAPEPAIPPLTFPEAVHA